MNDDDLFVPLTPATPNVTTKRCRRHEWRRVEFQPEGGGVIDMCSRCDAIKNPAVTRRNRNNRQRGGANERTVAKRHGGRRTGPLGGRDDVVVAEKFVIQSKRTLRLSLNECRTYLTDLARIYPTKTPYVTHHLPRERDGLVIIRESDWLAWHGPDEGPAMHPDGYPVDEMGG